VANVNYKPLLTDFYRYYLGRDPDPGGLQGWADAMNAGMREADVREAFLRSPEYAQRFPGEAAPPPPPPPPVPGGSMALHIEGNQFATANGVIKLQGSIICCADADAEGPGTLEMGWPLITAPALDLFKSYGLNFTHIRLGPMSQSEPNEVRAYAQVADGRFDLNRWDDMYWARLSNLLEYAQHLGIYVEVDLIDNWVLDHSGEGTSPWRADLNIQGFDAGGLAIKSAAPTGYVEQWLRKVVRETGGYDCVLYQDGNESFKGPQTAEWAKGLVAIIRDELRRNGYPYRLIGSNSQRDDINAFFDYAEYHEKEVPPVKPYPTMTNEYDDISPSAVLSLVRLANKAGVTVHYWRGSHNTADYRATLAQLLSPPSVPPECPPLVRWGSRVYNVMDSNFQPVASPVLGGFVVVDSTPRFGTGRGLPCNAEHNEVCGGRECEDPRGGAWALEEGSGPLHLQSNNFQGRVRCDSRGHYRVRVGPLPDVRDGEEGKPVTVVGDVSTVTEWDVP